MKYKPKSVSLVEFNRNNDADVRTLKEIVESWRVDSLTLLHDKDNKTRVIFITTQKQNFENLNPKAILGYTCCLDSECKENNTVKITSLYTNPKYKYKKNRFESDSLINKIIQYRRKYKEIGTVLVNEIKTKYKNRKINLVSARAAIPFYESLGFKHTEGPKSQRMSYE